jgi:hypothetical protein
LLDRLERDDVLVVTVNAAEKLPRIVGQKFPTSF